MRRREFIALIAGATAAWPLAARAQRPAKLPTIGFFGFSPSAWRSWTSAFLKGLSDLDWVEGRTIAIEYRWSDGRDDGFGEVAAELVRLKVDVIVTAGTSNVLAAMQATSVIPIVFAAAGDPIGNKLVSSLAHPGGNVTGLSLEQADIATKRLGLLREVVPDLHRLAIMANIGNPNGGLEMRQVETAARANGIEIVRLEIRQADDIAPAFITLKDRADALYVVNESLVNANRDLINKRALEERLPTMHGLGNTVEAGGLMSYGPDIQDQFRRAAGFVDKILQGTKPADIPVELPTKFILAINLKTAKALGLAVPQSLLSTADEVIE
jgi:putative tryptophan/tyrosine transport system substrate-binding protein